MKNLFNTLFYSKPVFRRGGPERRPAGGHEIKETVEKNKEVPNLSKTLVSDLLRHHGLEQFRKLCKDHKKRNKVKNMIKNWLIKPGTKGGYKEIGGNEMAGIPTSYEKNGRRIQEAKFDRLAGSILDWIQNNPKVIKEIIAKHKHIISSTKERESGGASADPGTPKRTTKFDTNTQINIVKALENALHSKMEGGLIYYFIKGPNIKDRTPKKLRERAQAFQKVANQYLKQKGFYLSINVKGTTIKWDFYPIDKTALPKKVKSVSGVSNNFEKHIKRTLNKV